MEALLKWVCARRDRKLVIEHAATGSLSVSAVEQHADCTTIVIGHGNTLPAALDDLATQIGLIPARKAGDGVLMTHLTLCGQATCEQPAAYRFTWPGANEALICEQHVGELRNIAAAMGLYVQVTPLEDEDVF